MIGQYLYLYTTNIFYLYNSSYKYNNKCNGHINKLHQIQNKRTRLNLSFPNLIKTFVVFATCDHDELVERLCIIIAGVRNGRTLLDVAHAIHGNPLPEDPAILLNVLGRLTTVETAGKLVYLSIYLSVLLYRPILYLKSSYDYIEIYFYL